MRRADRLFMIVEQLRPARLVTAQDLAQRLEVSLRTIYRDVADLIGAGVPIEGAAGLGYMMRAGYDLPPLMFTRDEAAALMAGIRMLQAHAGHDFARAGSEAINKITAVLPSDLARETANLPLYAPRGAIPNRPAPHSGAALATAENDPRSTFDVIKRAITQRRTLHIAYRSLTNVATTRWIEPAALFFWGDVWTLGAHCRMRGAVRMFRLDLCTVLEWGDEISPARAQELARQISTRHDHESQPQHKGRKV